MNACEIMKLFFCVFFLFVVSMDVMGTEEPVADSTDIEEQSCGDEDIQSKLPVECFEGKSAYSDVTRRYNLKWNQLPRRSISHELYVLNEPVWFLRFPDRSSLKKEAVEVERTSQFVCPFSAAKVYDPRNPQNGSIYFCGQHVKFDTNPIYIYSFQDGTYKMTYAKDPPGANSIVFTLGYEKLVDVNIQRRVLLIDAERAYRTSLRSYCRSQEIKEKIFCDLNQIKNKISR